MIAFYCGQLMKMAISTCVNIEIVHYLVFLQYPDIIVRLKLVVPTVDFVDFILIINPKSNVDFFSPRFCFVT